jgi:dynein heavy chain 2
MHLNAPQILRLISCLGSLARYVQRTLSSLDIWRGPFVATRDELRKGISLCEHWVTVCETLTSHFWKRFPLHPWEGDSLTPTVTVQLAARLEEVHV